MITQSAKEPPEYQRRVLFAVIGLSPQIITETCYALAVTSKPAFVPTEIHVLTTCEGRERIRHTLLSQQPGWFCRFRSEYQLPEITFDLEHIHLVKGADGESLDDIRDEDANARAADAITEQVRNFTADDSCALHVSIAGGRKTMGFYAGYALSLYGRSQDRLSHVLVSSPFEGNQDFFYPTRKSHILYTHAPENRPVDASEAKVCLAAIPFVRLRHGVPAELRKGLASYSEVVAATQQVLGPVQLIIDFDDRVISGGGMEFRLAPVELAFLSWIARKKVTHCEPISAPSEGVPEEGFSVEFLAELGHIKDAEYGRTAVRLKNGMNKAFFEQTLSRLRRQMKKALGPEGEWHYGVRAEGRPRRYSLFIPADSIHWKGML